MQTCRQRQISSRCQVRLNQRFPGIRIDFMDSCRKKNDKWVVAMDKWQKMTDMEVNKGRWRMLFGQFSTYLNDFRYP